MNATLSLPPEDDLDTQMLKVARNLAMDIYELDDILKNLSISPNDFSRWQAHPRFQAYLKSAKEEWNAASNAAERTKLKAATVMEDFMLEAHGALHDKKIALNHRVELGKLVAKIAGMGEPRTFANTGGSGPAFQLNIVIGKETVSIQPQIGKIINYDEDDDYDPLVSPNTLEGL